jgi:thymidylate synthase
VVGTADVRDALVYEYQRNPFQPMIEIKGASFIADAPAIIGKPNEDYIEKEIEWYESESLSIHDIPGGPPLMWRRTANPEGRINSNYGWVLYSPENGGGDGPEVDGDDRSQFGHVVAELRRDYASRRAVCIYTRPTMHVDQKLGGSGQDFMCTNAVHYSIDPETKSLDVCVQMRSNDVVFGYRNDYAWQKHAAYRVIGALADDFPLTLGVIRWQAASLHVYPRHYHLLRALANGTEEQAVTDGAV